MVLLWSLIRREVVTMRVILLIICLLVLVALFSHAEESEFLLPLWTNRIATLVYTNATLDIVVVDLESASSSYEGGPIDIIYLARYPSIEAFRVSCNLINAKMSNAIANIAETCGLKVRYFDRYAFLFPINSCEVTNPPLESVITPVQAFDSNGANSQSKGCD